jgi:hypothetical protein
MRALAFYSTITQYSVIVKPIPLGTTKTAIPLADAGGGSDFPIVERACHSRLDPTGRETSQRFIQAHTTGPMTGM